MKIKNNYFWLSLTLHLLLGASFLSVHLMKQAGPVISVSEMAAYVYHLPNQASIKSIAANELQKDTRKQTKSTLVIKNKIQSVRQESVQQNKAEAAVPAVGSHSEAVILKILHEAIFEKQTYPPSALLLHQSGTVTIHLSVSPSGEIVQEALLKSSRYRSLDEAALQAVSAISPVIAVRPYLNQTESFSIDVVFE